MNDPSTNRFVSERAVEEWQNACLQRTWYELIPFRNVLRMDGERMYTQAQKSARFARLIIVFFLSYWAAPSEGRRWYPRKPLHYNHRFCPRLVGAVAVGVKDVLSLWCLFMLLLCGPFAGPSILFRGTGKCSRLGYRSISCGLVMRTNLPLYFQSIPQRIVWG